MSGGSFDYAFYRAQDFADKLEEKLESAATESEPFEPATLEKLAHIAKVARHVSHLMKEAEYLYSGDNGEESFAKNLAKLPELVFKEAASEEGV
jgi:predicted house-cleaning noncanonical NTP pyrophosphatase (MazG superfamily)